MRPPGPVSGREPHLHPGGRWSVPRRGRKASQYFVGNHTIAERVFREDASAMLHAPLPALIYADPDGDTKLAVDQPSLLLAGYGNPQIAEVGGELDALLAELIRLLGGEVPPHL